MAAMRVTVTRKALEEANKTIIYDNHDEQHVASTVVYGSDDYYLYFDQECTVPLDAETCRNLFFSNTLVIGMIVNGGVSVFRPIECYMRNDMPAGCSIVTHTMEGEAVIKTFIVAELVDEPETEE